MFIVRLTSVLRSASSSSIACAAALLVACSGGTGNDEDPGGSGEEAGTGGEADTGGDGDGPATGGESAGDGDDGQPSGGADTGSGGGSGESDDLSACDDSSLQWKTARKTTYTSYPDPQSVECVEYNGCMWAGLFAGCNGKQSEEWVEANDIAAVFPGYGDLAHHRLCIRSGERVMIVNVIDTCADSDCDGCCTENQGANDALIDLESYTNARWGLPDGIIEWADLGPNPTPICQ